MTKVTQNEYKVLRAILRNNFHNMSGAWTIGSEIWSDCINDSQEPSGIEGKTLSAVVSSLSQKGLVKKFGPDVVALTAEGYNIAVDKPQ